MGRPSGVGGRYSRKIHGGLLVVWTCMFVARNHTRHGPCLTSVFKSVLLLCSRQCLYTIPCWITSLTDIVCQTLLLYMPVHPEKRYSSIVHKRGLPLTPPLEFWCWVVPMLALFFAVTIRLGVPQINIFALLSEFNRKFKI